MLHRQLPAEVYTLEGGEVYEVSDITVPGSSELDEIILAMDDPKQPLVDSILDTLNRYPRVQQEARQGHIYRAVRQTQLAADPIPMGVIHSAVAHRFLGRGLAQATGVVDSLSIVEVGVRNAARQRQEVYEDVTAIMYYAAMVGLRDSVVITSGRFDGGRYSRGYTVGQARTELLVERPRLAEAETIRPVRTREELRNMTIPHAPM